MKAVCIVEANGPQGLALKDVPEPSPDKGQLLIDVKAVGLNRADLLQSMGMYGEPTGTLGMEYSGVVVRAAAGFKKGERVAGLTRTGAWAERLAVPANQVVRVPKRLSDTDAAAVVEAFATAYDAVWLQAKAKKGQTLLIHAVGSGVGTAAVQLARALGLKSVGTSRSQGKLDRAKELGLETGLLVTDSIEFGSRAQQPDICLDLVGGAYFPETIAAMAPRGTIMLVGLTAGPSAEVPLFQLLGKRLRVIGTTLRARDDRERAALFKALARDVMPLFTKKKLKAVVSDVKPMAQFKEALEAMGRNETFGKVVLAW
jgi:NADPH2:quinone reductase